MIRFVESLGDRMVQVVVPRAVALAASTAACEWSVICKNCSACGGGYQYRYQCCTNGTGCKCLPYRACPLNCVPGCPC